MDNLAQYIKTKRESLNMSQQELSEKTKLSVAVIDDLENGRFERYTGDEMYVKAYLKKIGEALDLDIEGMTSTYMGLTRELKQSEVEAEIQKKAEEKEKIQQRNKLSLDDVKIKVPEFTKSQSVYTDNRSSKILQSAIIIVVIIAIIAVCFFGIMSTRTKVDEPSSFESNMTTDIQDNTDQSESNEDTNTVLNEDLTIVRNGSLDYSVTLPTNTTSIVLKIEYGCRSWSSLYADDTLVSDFEERLYTKGEVVEVTLDTTSTQIFRLHNGYNLDNKYYINDVEVPNVDNLTNVADVYFRITNNQTSDSNTVSTENTDTNGTTDTTDTTDTTNSEVNE